MRLIDADELIEHAYRDKLDTRELIADMINNAPTIKEIPVNMPLDLISKALKQAEPIGNSDKLGTAKKTLVVADNTTAEQFGNSEELDCISREQAIKCLECDFDITGRANMEVVVNYINSAHDKIMNLPSVKQEPKTEWIPVSERLPEEGEDVLVWYEYFRYGDYNCMWQTYGIGWQYNGHFSVDNGGVKQRVIAWCELPKPYKESEEI